MRRSVLVNIICVVSVGFAYADERPDKRNIQDSLAMSLPPYFSVSEIKIKAQSLDTNAGTYVWTLTPNLELSVLRGPDEPFLKSLFAATIAADADLYESAGTQCGVPLIKKIAAKGETFNFLGTSASKAHGEAWVTKILGFDRSAPPGQPLDNYSKTSIIEGSPQAEQAKLSACNEIKSKRQVIRDTLLHKWSGYYVCSQGETGAELTLNELSDLGNIRGTFKFFPLRGMRNAKSGSFLISGTYKFDSETLHVDPAGWIEQPDGYSPIAMDFGRSSDSRLEGKIADSNCAAIVLKRAD